jgi:glycosyltransferase involved in cell wall biosynthesis
LSLQINHPLQGTETMPRWSDERPLSIAVLTQQISHYHVARYKAAAKRFHRLTVISAMNDADFPQFLSVDRSGVETVELFGSRPAYLDAVAAGRLWPKTAEALTAAAPDVVAVAGWAFPESLAAIAWAHLRGVPLVLMSESQQQDAARTRYRELIKSRIVRACHTALVGGRAHGVYLRRLGMAVDKTFYGYDAVDNAHFTEGANRARICGVELRRALGLPERYLLASGRFIAKKNLPRLIRAFGAVLAHDTAPHHLIVLGDGPERSSMRRAVDEADLGERVHFPGFQPYERLPIYYGLAEAFVHVALAEQWGLVVNEAAAAGLPLIVSRACGAAELIEDGANGILVDPTDTASISRALAAVMQAPPGECAAMGLRSRQIIADWGPDRFADGLARAADAAKDAPPRHLAVWDRALLRALSRRSMSAVP